MDKAFLEITNSCNLACSFCHGTARAPRRVTAAEFEMLTDRLAGRVTYLYFHVMGEPLLHPLLPQFIDSAWQKGFRPMLTTNGTLLASRGDELLAHLPFKISISLHAPAANPAFAEEGYWEGCLDFAKRAANGGCITVLRLWNGEGESAENEPVLKLLRAAFPDEWQRNRSGYKLADHLFLEWGERFVWPDPENAPLPPPHFCFALRDQIGVLVDGTVTPCCLDAEGHLALGNLFEAPLDLILSTPRARAIYEGFSRSEAAESLCRGCGVARRIARADKDKG